MQKFRELTEFCERIENGGRPEQQYVAEGIRELLDFYEEFSGSIGEDGQIKLAEEKTESKSDRGLFPKTFPEKGYLVELSDGSLWAVEDLCYRCRQKKQAANDDGEMRFSIENMSFDFTAGELSDGIVTVYGKESA